MASYVKDHFSYYTIRCTSCELLVSSPSSRCHTCNDYRRILNAMVFRQQKEPEEGQPQSHTNYRYFNTPEKKLKFQQLRSKTRVCVQREKRLRERLEKAVEERGVQVSDDLHDDLSTTMEESATAIREQYSPESFQRIFWEQQYRAMQLKDSRSMRWEPAMIRSVFIFSEVTTNLDLLLFFKVVSLLAPPFGCCI